MDWESWVAAYFGGGSGGSKNSGGGSQYGDSKTVRAVAGNGAVNLGAWTVATGNARATSTPEAPGPGGFPQSVLIGAGILALLALVALRR